MESNQTRCCRCVGDIQKMIKYGKTKSGSQRFICRACKKSRVENYAYLAYKGDINQNIIQLTKEGLGIRSTARILKISTTTLLKRIVIIARNITKPIISKGKTYEVDELCTYIRHKKNYIWLVYALEKNSKTVVSFNVGKRTNKTLSRVLDTLKLSEAKKIFTDRLKNYRYLINEKMHSVKRFGTNHIERKNLTLRTHLKRLNRRTICFSKSLVIFTAVLKIYFWI
ncbi:IS1 family transposase ISEcret4 [Flavobacterium bizetiae]|uniref:IS1 family transposase ISEcret4 n=1 Tax=Flavobacterium bizetiae TaxID=2704140 RepID=A0A6J4GGA5_9FLAO|nr:IS1 family transposase [Flavobacterium bizetiae]CAA9197345.1 IS1 family transposase ISEcret4 [Flavobacterium bizetiae]CAD5342554.1 IS1 family transposase ISEcret4 [Flavobacterium bizetiae]CAD5348089.1 IS1 family transposase ISEcret4 [Flavobacterium bizetiae]